MDLITLALAKKHAGTLVNELRESLSTVYKYRGNVDTADDLLNITNPNVGDVYNILDTGMNACWNGEIWDELGATVDLKQLVDDIMTDYDISTVQQEAIQRLVDKVTEMERYQEQLVNLSGFMWFQIDENGHLIFTKTPMTNVDFEISENGHLIAMEVE